MPVEKDLDPTQPRINRWLEEVESAINQGSLYGIGETEKAECWNRKGQNRPPLHNFQPPPRDIFNNSRNIQYLNLETPYIPSSAPGICFSQNSTRTALTLPKISELSVTRLPSGFQNIQVGVEFEKHGKDSRMESTAPTLDEEFDCRLSVTESVSNDDKERRIIPEISFKKDKRFLKRVGKPLNNNDFDPFVAYKSGSTDFRYQQDNCLVDTQAPSCCEKEKLALPTLRSCDTSSSVTREVPSITVCEDEESSVSKAKQQELSLDPRFLMPTEASVDESRYLLATRRSSLPTFGRGMRSRSLDMVLEDQTIGITRGDKAVTPLSSLRVPRHRNRSRSLDNSLETNTSFAAFKESLKLRNVRNNVLGT